MDKAALFFALVAVYSIITFAMTVIFMRGHVERARKDGTNDLDKRGLNDD